MEDVYKRQVFFFVDSLEMGGGLGNFLALLSGLAYAGVFLLNDLPDSDAISSVFWGDVLSAITGLPFLVKETDFSPTAITSLVVLGVFQVAVAYILLTIGLKTTPPVTASLVSGIEPVLNPIPVSYTHLDVYKRQVLGRCFADQEEILYQDILLDQVHEERMGNTVLIDQHPADYEPLIH